MQRTLSRLLLILTLASVSLAQIRCSSEPAIPGVPPGTHSSFVEQFANTKLRTLDLLLVVDNSPSMSDKQELLSQAIPGFINRLINPQCVDSSGNASPNPGRCPRGTGQEFEAIPNLRVAVITSSLGGHGSDACPRSEEGKDDRGWFIPSVRQGVPDPEETGFLSWRGGTAEELDLFVQNVQAHVQAAGSTGCEFPAPLEAWYRALVDPNPPQEIVINSNGLSAPRRGEAGDLLVDEVLLRQREAFLRPQGLLSVVVLSDQDDCSLMSGGTVYENSGLGHLLVDDSFRFPQPTAACEANPNDECCFSCLVADSASEHCDQSSCQESALLLPEQDRYPVRCADTKRRFGIDLTYPIQRYVDGLTKPTVVDHWTGEETDNPLLRGAGENAGRPRDPGLIFFTGLVGVPWQDIATDSSLTDPTIMEFRTASELVLKDVDFNGIPINRWEVILGSPGFNPNSPACEENPANCGLPPSPPLDPFVQVSISPRPSGLVNPISGDAIVDFSSNSPTANAINGHESNHSAIGLYDGAAPANDAIQAACIFPLETPIDCNDSDVDCLCADEPTRNRAACQAPGGGEAKPIQHWAEAKPAPRILQVLRDFGANSVVGSICPKISQGGNITDPNFGLNPATEALTDRLTPKVTPKCFPYQLPVDDEGQVPCIVVEAWPDEGDVQSEDDDACSMESRSPVNPQTRKALLRRLEESGRCGGNSGINCPDYRMCALDQLQGNARKSCLVEEWPEHSEHLGFCYIDGESKNREGDFDAGGSPEGNPLIKNCPASEPRRLHFVGQDVPRPNSITFVACQLEDLSSSSDVRGRHLRPRYPWPYSKLTDEPPEIPPPPDGRF